MNPHSADCGATSLALDEEENMAPIPVTGNEFPSARAVDDENAVGSQVPEFEVARLATARVMRRGAPSYPLVGASFVRPYAQDFSFDLGGGEDERPPAGGPPPPDTPITAPVLERWSVEAHAYSKEVVAKVGLLGGLFGGDVTRLAAGAIHVAKRYTVLEDSTGSTFESGVAVRLFAATTDWKVNAQLTIPNLAANAQLNSGDTRVAIDVLGYSGPLGELLPAPDKLDVLTLSIYLTAFHGIQAAVFSDAGLPFLKPVRLNLEDDPQEAPRN